MLGKLLSGFVLCSQIISAVLLEEIMAKNLSWYKINIQSYVATASIWGIYSMCLGGFQLQQARSDAWSVLQLRKKKVTVWICCHCVPMESYRSALLLAQVNRTSAHRPLPSVLATLPNSEDGNSYLVYLNIKLISSWIWHDCSDKIV